MLGMFTISVERLAGFEFGDQTGVERTVEVQKVAPDLKTRDAGDELRQFF